MKRVTLPLVYKDVNSRNGWRIPFDIFKKAVEEKYIQQRLQTGTFFIISYSQYSVMSLKNHLEISPYDSLGRVIGFDLDNLTAVVELDCDVETEGRGLYLSYICNEYDIAEDGIKVFKDCRIVGACINDANKSAYL